MKPMRVRKVIGFKEQKSFNEVFGKELNKDTTDTRTSNTEFERLSSLIGKID